MLRSALYIYFLLAFTAVAAQEAIIKERVDVLNKAFTLQSDSVLNEHLAGNFSVGAYMGRTAIQSLNTVLSNYKLDSVALEKVVKQDTVWVAYITLHGAKTSSSSLYFNQKLQLLRCDLFDALYGMNREQVAQKVATIPFEDRNGSIILTVTLNDNRRPLRLLFDTGADGMMLNKALADSVGLVVSHQQQASVVGGNIHIEVSKNNKVHLNGFTIDQQSIAVFGNGEHGTDGIIGNTIAKRYITHVNYDTKELTLYSFGKFTPQAVEQKVPVDVSTGNIQMNAVLSVRKEKPVNARFILDTGAGYNLIVFRPLVLKHKLLVDGFEADSTGSTVSMGIATPVFHGKAAQLKLLPALTVDQLPVALMGSGSGTSAWRPETDGSLGIRFISRYNFTINLMDKYVSFEPR